MQSQILLHPSNEARFIIHMLIEQYSDSTEVGAMLDDVIFLPGLAVPEPLDWIVFGDAVRAQS